MNEDIQAKAKKRINETKRLLKKYDESFFSYVKEVLRRDCEFSLGEIVQTNSGKGIICGWNNSSNFDVYCYAKDEICNIHPSEIRKEQR